MIVHTRRVGAEPYPTIVVFEDLGRSEDGLRFMSRFAFDGRVVLSEIPAIPMPTADQRWQHDRMILAGEGIDLRNDDRVLDEPLT